MMLRSLTSRSRRGLRFLFRALILLTVLYFIVPFIDVSRHRNFIPYDPSHLFTTRPPLIQHDFGSTAAADADRLAAVRAEFEHAYQAYRRHGWLRDEVRPLSAGTRVKYCGWAATLIDALDTLFIMGFEEEFEEAVHAVSRMRLAYAPSVACSINPFEMTIRHLGGLLSAYDVSGRRDERLKRKALAMGEMLFQAYGQNGVQCRSIIWPRLSWWPCPPNGILSLARLGSQTLELLQLSIISGKEKFAEKARFLSGEMRRLQSTSEIPGLWPKFFDGTCDKGVCDLSSSHQFFTTGSGADSAYEYLVKSHLLYGRVDDSYQTMWKQALPQLKRHLLFQPMAPNNTNLLFPSEVTLYEGRATISGKTEHLSCFLGGLFALSSRTTVDSSDDLEVAAKLTEGCTWAYQSAPLGIMPDELSVVVCPNTHLDCAWDQKTFRRRAGVKSEGLPPGFADVNRAHYLLRPEAIESVFIMYRITGDEVWRERGWDMFVAVRNATRAKYGHAAIPNVMKTPGEAEQLDEMESFWFSETLKYFYLLFAHPALVSLDDWVLNTEGHPFRIGLKHRGELLR